MSFVVRNVVRSPHPLLTVVTRTAMRPNMLRIALQGLNAQTDQDFQLLIIDDPEGDGISTTHIYLAQRNWSDVVGKYVYFLDDDNIIPINDFIAGIRKIVEKNNPDVIVAKVVNSEKGVLPIRWEKPPARGEIDLGNIIAKTDLFKRNIGYMTADYWGDYVYVRMALATAEKRFWWDRVVMVQPVISHGIAEPDDYVPMLQYPSEIYQLAEVVKNLEVSKALEIGSLYGGTLRQWLSVMRPGGVLVSVDLIPSRGSHSQDHIQSYRNKWKDWAAQFGIELVQIIGNSNDVMTVHRAMKYAMFDFIFVDGGHDYPTVRNDFGLYFPMLVPKGLMAFHDIAYPDNNSGNIDVGAFWRDMKDLSCFRMEEILDHTNQTEWGIGLMYKERI